MKKITRTSEEYRKQKEKELEDSKCPECDKKGVMYGCNLLDSFYSCECGCEWVVTNGYLLEKTVERFEVETSKAEPIKRDKSFFGKVRERFGL